MSLRDDINFPLAMKRLMSDQTNDAWQDVVLFRDFRALVDDQISFLLDTIAGNTYQPSEKLEIYIPKPTKTIRPGIYISPIDRLLYQGIVDILAPHFQPQPCVFSNKLNDLNNKNMFKQGVDLWLEFQEAETNFLGQYEFVVYTDLTSYFDLIRHDRLIQQIQSLFSKRIDEETLTQCSTCLKSMFLQWANRRHIGIPQIMDPSSFLSNIYLDELDQMMIRSNIPYIRYVDDIRMFAHTQAEAQNLLQKLIIYLRTYGLFVNSSKTKIIESSSAKESGLEREKKISEIEESLKNKQLDEASHIMEETIFSMINEPGLFDDRLFRFCINRFRRIKVTGKNDESCKKIALEVVNRLHLMPHATDIFIGYLSLFKNDEDIIRLICEFIEGEFNIYPWQINQLLELLIRIMPSAEMNQKVREVSQQIAQNKSQHIACRSKAFILWGYVGDDVDRSKIKILFDSEESIQVKRAMIIALQEMNKGERGYLFSNCHGNEIEMTINYINRVDEPTYHYFLPPEGFSFDEILDWDDMNPEDFLY